MQRILLALCLCLIAVVGITGTGCSQKQPLQIEQHSIVVSEFTGDVSYSSAMVKGIARNTGYLTLNNCAVKVVFYDYMGDEIAALTETREILNPGEVWNFNVTLKGNDAWKVAKYDISVSGN